MSFNFNEVVKQAETDHNIGKTNTEWLTKFEIGETKIRLLSHTVIFPQHFKKDGYKGICFGKEKGCPGCIAADKPNIKWLGWVYHDEKLKPCLLPHTIVKDIGNYQNDPEYAFNEPPMPYDITIIKTKTGDKEQNVKYSLKASRFMTEIPAEIMTELAKKNTPDALKEKMKEKKMKELGLVSDAVQPESEVEDVMEEINPDNIPY